jgi:YHS domain-containing protein
MPRDPVCGHYVEENTPFKSQADGEIRYFCSRECLEEYEFDVEEEEFVEPAQRKPKDED